jgi:hypothetical protein
VRFVDEDNDLLAVVRRDVAVWAEIHFLKLLDGGDDDLGRTVGDLLAELANGERLRCVGEQAVLERVANLRLEILSVDDDVDCRVAKFRMGAQLVGGEQY